jgi:hypothetical protein
MRFATDSCWDLQRMSQTSIPMNHSSLYLCTRKRFHCALILALAIFFPVYAQRTPTRDTAEKNYRGGLAPLQKQQVDPAISLFRESIRLNPNLAEAR